MNWCIFSNAPQIAERTRYRSFPIRGALQFVSIQFFIFIIQEKRTSNGVADSRVRLFQPQVSCQLVSLG